MLSPAKRFIQQLTLEHPLQFAPSSRISAGPVRPAPYQLAHRRRQHVRLPADRRRRCCLYPSAVRYPANRFLRCGSTAVELAPAAGGLGAGQCSCSSSPSATFALFGVKVLPPLSRTCRVDLRRRQALKRLQMLLANGVRFAKAYIGPQVIHPHVVGAVLSDVDWRRALQRTKHRWF